LAPFETDVIINSEYWRQQQAALIILLCIKSDIYWTHCVGRQQNRDWGKSFCRLDEDGATVDGLVACDAPVCCCWNSQAPGQMQRLQRIPHHWL